jgi:hypothetical protein
MFDPHFDLSDNLWYIHRLERRKFWTVGKKQMYCSAEEIVPTSGEFVAELVLHQCCDFRYHDFMLERIASPVCAKSERS